MYRKLITRWIISEIMEAAKKKKKINGNVRTESRNLTEGLIST